MLPASVSGLGGGFGNVACYLLLLAMLWCDRRACSGVRGPSASEASMVGLGSDCIEEVNNRALSESECHAARLPLE